MLSYLKQDHCPSWLPVKLRAMLRVMMWDPALREREKKNVPAQDQGPVLGRWETLEGTA